MFIDPKTPYYEDIKSLFKLIYRFIELSIQNFQVLFVRETERERD